MVRIRNLAMEVMQTLGILGLTTVTTTIKQVIKEETVEFVTKIMKDDLVLEGLFVMLVMSLVIRLMNVLREMLGLNFKVEGTITTTKVLIVMVMEIEEV